MQLDSLCDDDDDVAVVIVVVKMIKCSSLVALHREGCVKANPRKCEFSLLNPLPQTNDSNS